MKYELSFRRLCRDLALANEFVKKMGKNKSKRLVFEHFLLPVLLNLGRRESKEEEREQMVVQQAIFFLDRLILPLTSTVLTNGIRMTLALKLWRYSRVIFRLQIEEKIALSNNARESL